MLNIEKAKQIIKDNYFAESDSFMYLLHERDTFSIEKLNEYTNCITYLTESTTEHSINILMQLNDTYQYILRNLLCHFDPSDLHILSNLPQNYTEYIDELARAIGSYGAMIIVDYE